MFTLKSDKQIDAEAPNRGERTVGTPMTMTRQRAIQRTSTSGEARLPRYADGSDRLWSLASGL